MVRLIQAHQQSAEIFSANSEEKVRMLQDASNNQTQTQEAAMPEVKIKGPSMEERIANRLRNSGVGMGTQPDKTIQKGDSPNRLFHNAHHSGGHSTPTNAQHDRNDGDWRK
jgi:hypothetical protein